MKVRDKKVGDIEYYKYRINLPKKIVEELKLFDKELKIEIEGKKIIIEREN